MFDSLGFLFTFLRALAMEQFEADTRKFFDQINIQTSIKDSINSNKQYVCLDLRAMFNLSPKIFECLQTDYPLHHNIIRQILQRTVCDMNYKQLLDPTYRNNIICHKIKDMTTKRLNKLSTFKATITRTTAVRPELSIGCFTCEDCYTPSYVLQKNLYTPPNVCSNPLCKNRKKFKLNLNLSTFNDWQKVYCQEAFTEADNGSVPKTLVLYCRGYCTEMMFPGDTVLVTGVLTVLESEAVDDMGGMYELVFVVNYAEPEDMSSGIGGISKSYHPTERHPVGGRNSKPGESYQGGIENLDTGNMIYDKFDSLALKNEKAVGVLNSERVDLTPAIHGPDASMTKTSDLVDAKHPNCSNGDSRINNHDLRRTDNYSSKHDGNIYSSEPRSALPELKIVDTCPTTPFLCVDQFIQYIRNTPNLYTELAESLFPYIHGHSLIKHAILLMLAQGTMKTSQNMSIRPDINILLVGDPGTAKSQFLKTTSQVLPRSVYTSGKSASAAGLTACVIKDQNSEFSIEAGALMLSDKAVCCIDEFDKMTLEDRVSIHEAMEQGTISINKAGINATLNARCSVLAAANPVMGRYDERKTLRQNINLTDAIMSRFDLYFVVIDTCDPTNDERIAERVIAYHTEDDDMELDGVESDLNGPQRLDNNGSLFDNSQRLDYNGHSQDHMNDSPPFSRQNSYDGIYTQENLYGEIHDKAQPNSHSSKPKFSMEEIREYLQYIRKNINPKLTKQSKRTIVEKYQKLRQDSLINPTNYRVTIRQLESLIRLSEALAKIHCDETVNCSYVEEAYRLLKGSVIEIQNEDIIVNTDESSKKSLTIGKKDYIRMMNSFVYLLKTKEYLTSTELVNEYLLLRENMIESVEQLNYEEMVARVVIEQLIHKEGVLYELDGKVHIHPNYDV